MKKKAKKISLNRETLRSLDQQNLDAVVGGVTAAVCATKNPTVCNVNSGCYSCDVCEPPGTRTCPP